MAFETEEADMPAFALVNCIATQDLERLTGLLERQDFLVIRLDGTNVTDKASFLKQAEADLPRPTDLFPHNWDALADTLWNGLFDLKANQVALVWTQAQRLAHGDLQDFLDAIRILSDVARQVMDGANSFPRPLTMLLFLVGDGSEFRRL